MSELITEIERVKQLMGIANNEKPLISENVGVLGKLARQADELLSDAAENKAMIKNLDNLRTKGVKGLTQKEIDDLAEALAKDASAIKAAMANVSYDAGIAAAKRIKSMQKLDLLIRNTRRAENESLMNLFVEKQLARVFENGYGPWGQAYNQAMTETLDVLQTYVESVAKVSEDELVSFFLEVIEKEMKDGDIPDFKFSDYPEYVNWIKKKLLTKGGTLDDIIETGKSAIKQSDLGIDRFKASSDFFTNRKTYFDGKTETDLALGDIKVGSLTNFRLVTNAVRRFKSWFQGNKTLILNYEKNVALLKGFPVENIMKEVNGKVIPSNEFAALVRNIGFDIDQIATLEQNVLKRWQDLMEEVKIIDPKLVEGMEKVPIFKEGMGGLSWQEETLNTFIDRLKLRYEAPMKEGGGFFGIVQEELKELLKVITLSKESIIFATSNSMKGIAGFIKGLVSRRFFSAGLWGVPITPKQVGLLLSRRGFNRGFFLAMVESWVMLQVWQNVVSSIVAILAPIFEYICNKLFNIMKWETRCTDDLRTIQQYWKESLTSIWTDVDSYYNLGFDKGFIIKGIEWFNEEIIDDPISETEIKLVEDADKYIKQFWNALDEKTQEKLLNQAAKESGSDFQIFTNVTNPNNDPTKAFFHKTFLNKNEITEDQSKKLYDARVLTAPQSIVGKLSAENAKNLISNPKKLSKVEDYLKVGGVEDKNGVVYTIKKGADSYSWTFVPPSEEIRFGVQPVGNNDAFYIYRDDSSKEVYRLTADDLKKEGFNTGFDENGLFKSKEEAKKVRDTLQELHPSVPQKELTIQQMIAKL